MSPVLLKLLFISGFDSELFTLFFKVINIIGFLAYFVFIRLFEVIITRPVKVTVVWIEIWVYWLNIFNLILYLFSSRGSPSAPSLRLVILECLLFSPGNSSDIIFFHFFMSIYVKGQHLLILLVVEEIIPLAFFYL